MKKLVTAPWLAAADTAPAVMNAAALAVRELNRNRERVSLWLNSLPPFPIMRQ